MGSILSQNLSQITVGWGSGSVSGGGGFGAFQLPLPFPHSPYPTPKWGRHSLPPIPLPHPSPISGRRQDFALLLLIGNFALTCSVFALHTPPAHTPALPAHAMHAMNSVSLKHTWNVPSPAPGVDPEWIRSGSGTGWLDWLRKTGTGNLLLSLPPSFSTLTLLFFSSFCLLPAHSFLDPYLPHLYLYLCRNGNRQYTVSGSQVGGAMDNMDNMWT